MFVNIQVTFLVGKWHLSHLCAYATYHADIIIIIIIIITAIEFSLGGSNPYTKQIRKNVKNETIQRHSTDNTKYCTYNYTYYQDTHTIQNKLHTKWNSLNTVKFPQHKVTLRYMVLLSNRSWCLIAGIIIFKWQRNSVWVPTRHAVDDTKPWRSQNIPPTVRLL